MSAIKSNNLQSRTLLVRFSMSAFSNKHTDHRRTEIVDNTTGYNSGAFIADLFPRHDLRLQLVNRACAQLRRMVNKNSLPWAVGVRIIESVEYFNFMRDFSHARSVLFIHVDELCNEYDDLMNRAKQYHGEYFNATLYPRSAEELRAAWDVRLAIDSLPDVSSDFRDAVDPEIVIAVQQAQQETYNEVAKSWFASLHDLIVQCLTSTTSCNPRSVYNHARLMSRIVLDQELVTFTDVLEELIDRPLSVRNDEEMRTVLSAWLGTH